MLFKMSCKIFFMLFFLLSFIGCNEYLGENEIADAVINDLRKYFEIENIKLSEIILSAEGGDIYIYEDQNKCKIQVNVSKNGEADIGGITAECKQRAIANQRP